MELNGTIPPIDKMDAALSSLKACKCVARHKLSCACFCAPPLLACRAGPVWMCLGLDDIIRDNLSHRACPTPFNPPRHLALSTNAIEKITSLTGLDNLRILSLGRNQIKKIEGLDAVADTLEELWLSYNVITSLSGIERAQKLRVLYLSNNKIAGWSEIDKLSTLPSLEELLLVGNPLYQQFKDQDNIAAYRWGARHTAPHLHRVACLPSKPRGRRGEQGWGNERCCTTWALPG